MPEFLSAHGISDHGSEQKRDGRSEYRSYNSISERHPQSVVVKDDGKIRGRKVFRQKPYPAQFVNESVGDGADDYVPKGIEGDDCKQDKQGIVKDVERINFLFSQNSPLPVVFY